MKKFLVVFALLLLGMAARAEYVEVETNVSMANFWEKNGKETQKVMDVGTKIINANRLDKRIPIMVMKDAKYVNAFSVRNPKVVVVSTGLLPYIDNDDELAFVMGHEMSHSLDAYEGPQRWLSMKFNSKSYEYKADLIGIDLMAKAGFNPVASITSLSKFAPEPMFDFGIFTSHPKTSKRALEMYKYIYKKYPSALETDMIKNVNYQNFTYYCEKELKDFQQEESYRKNQRKIKYSL